MGSYPSLNKCCALTMEIRKKRLYKLNQLNIDAALSFKYRGILSYLSETPQHIISLFMGLLTCCNYRDVPEQVLIAVI